MSPGYVGKRVRPKWTRSPKQSNLAQSSGSEDRYCWDPAFGPDWCPCDLAQVPNPPSGLGQLRAAAAQLWRPCEDGEGDMGGGAGGIPSSGLSGMSRVPAVGVETLQEVVGPQVAFARYRSAKLVLSPGLQEAYGGTECDAFCRQDEKLHGRRFGNINRTKEITWHEAEACRLKRRAGGSSVAWHVSLESGRDWETGGGPCHSLSAE